MLEFSVVDSESETSWSELFTSLKSRRRTSVGLAVTENNSDRVAIEKSSISTFLGSGASPFFKDCSRKLAKETVVSNIQILKEIYIASKIEINQSLLDKTLVIYAETAPKAKVVLKKILMM